MEFTATHGRNDSLRLFESCSSVLYFPESRLVKLPISIRFFGLQMENSWIFPIFPIANWAFNSCRSRIGHSKPIMSSLSNKIIKIWLPTNPRTLLSLDLIKHSQPCILRSAYWWSVQRQYPPSCLNVKQLTTSQKSHVVGVMTGKQDIQYNAYAYTWFVIYLLSGASFRFKNSNTFAG